MSLCPNQIKWTRTAQEEKCSLVAAAIRTFLSVHSSIINLASVLKQSGVLESVKASSVIKKRLLSALYLTVYKLLE